MSVIKIILLASVLSVNAAYGIPACQDPSVVFTAEPVDVVVACGPNKVATFPCHYEGTQSLPQWKINSTSYGSLILPERHAYLDRQLVVTNVKAADNNTVYQCQLVLNQGSQVCIYRSTAARLIVKCKALDVNYTSRYIFVRQNLNSLVQVATAIPQVAQSFHISYNSTSGINCGSADISASSCQEGICRNKFIVSESPCSNTSDINLMVISNGPDSYGFSYMSEPIKIDAVNNFFQISFVNDRMLSTLYLNFTNQPKESEKTFSIKYGPFTQGCKYLPSQMEGHVSYTNLLSVELNQMESTSLCFVISVNNATKLVTMEGTYDIDVATASLDSSVRLLIGAVILVIVSVTTLITVVMILCMCLYYNNIMATKKHKISVSYRMNNHCSKECALEEEPGEGELDDMFKNSKPMDHQSPIDLSTTYFELLRVDEDCSMYEFGMSHFPNYNPENGYGYFKRSCHASLEFTSRRKEVQVILMEKDVPAYTASISALNVVDNNEAVYEQSRSFSTKLTSGSSFLYCACSNEITTTSFYKMFDISEECKETDFITQNIPKYPCTQNWSQYCYFEFTKPEFIKPHQNIIVLMKNGKLVTGPGVRHLVGAIDDRSEKVHPSRFREEWDRVFIQSRTADRELIPGSKYLFCAMMDRVPAHVHFSIYNVRKLCNMAEFGRRQIPGYQPERGYGYYEFKQDEFFKPNKQMILVHKEMGLFTGGGAQFICAGDEYNMDTILQKHKISPPDLSKTEWKHIFIQSCSDKRKLSPGTKFLYCEYKTYK